jgi:transposase-like protein
MARKNRYYPPEFKREALAMLATGEYTMAELERELGITPGLVKG